MLWFLAALAAAALVAFAVRADFFAQTSIRVGKDRVRRTGYLGRSADCSRAAVARVIEITLTAWPLDVDGAIPAKWLIFLDAQGNPLLRAYAEYYPPRELTRLREALAVPWEARREISTFAYMRKEIPGSFPWVLGHMQLIGGLGAVGIVMGVIGVIAVTM